MALPHRIPIISTLILMLLQTPLEANTSRPSLICPLGFKLAFTKTGEKPICYRLKGPEKAEDMYRDCVGNLYSIKLYRGLNITSDTDKVLWTEYRTSYVGGPFIDWSYRKSTGKLFDKFEKSTEEYEDHCVVFNSDHKYESTVCNGVSEHFRYCFVKPYPMDRDMSSEGCKDFRDSRRIWSPSPTCLLAVKEINGDALRANWSRSLKICKDHGGMLLNRGWIYSNIPWLHTSKTREVTYPLGIIYYPNRTLENAADGGFIPDSEWNFTRSVYPNETSFGFVRAGSWDLANSSFIYSDVMCEKPVILKSIALHVSVEDDTIVLHTNDTIGKEDISCFTDSKTFYPTPVKIELKYNHTFILTPISNGYYWCVLTDPVNYVPSVSNKALFIRVEEELSTLYAVKIIVPTEYDFDNVETVDGWKKKVREYIYYYTKYTDVETLDKDLDDDARELILKGYMGKESDGKDKDAVTDVKLKQVNRDRLTIFAHMALKATMRPVPPGSWRGIRVDYMRPTNYCSCQGVRFIDRIKLNCVECTCHGDFNVGYDVTYSGAETPCSSTLAPMKLNDEVTVLMPSIGSTLPGAPEEQLQQVIQDLESLLSNDSAVVTVQNINSTFDQVDELLEENVDLNIPGNLLHLLDGIGARMDLNGSEKATAVRSNIALLVTDADPRRPVRGLRIAATTSNVFTESAFQILREAVNSSQLQTGESDVVVQLPESVGTSTRRISFVAFRNDRAFQTSHYTINSRVLSVNVENLTQFDRNQYIDISFSPSGDPNRNESRACAYWQFQADGGGYWSQDGCTFMRATTPGALDTCRCDHLTHFAEILIPKAVFSERNETALELLTVIGCCLSIIGLAMVGLTAGLFRTWRRDFNNKIWLQLCIAIFLLVLCFLVVVFVKFDTYDIPCMLIGVALHYSTLASFCWMLVAAVLSYRRLVLVFNRDTSHKLMKAAAFAWGAPFAVVGVLLSVDPHSYAGRFEEKTPTGAFCYPSGLSLWLAVFTPIIVMLIANWTLFFLIVRSVFASRRVQRHGDSHNEALRCASVSCLLVFLFGLPWVFGAFSFNIVAAYLFTLTATYQGFILFLFFVLGNKKTRDLWLNKLKIKQTRKVPVTSSTYTNRTTGSSGRPIGPASEDGKKTKPRSLATLDDSRFS